MPPTALLRTVVLVLVGVSGASFGALALIPPTPPHDLAFGLVLCAGGVLLTWVGLTSRRVGRIAWLATVVVALAGLFLSLLVVREDVCCMYAYHRGLGFPWGWLDSGATVATRAAVEELQANPGQLATQIDVAKMGLDTAFWWYAGVLLCIPASRMLQRRRPSPRRRGGAHARVGGRGRRGL
ncbi:hypothetical protein ABN028_11845 [Actinopolymorpha sp. B17G11]|uniref:hypothetical protein n=1 Tax=Actinopolymorpha sp. B17G11 TaxID=3160861 RepID=UPI0032E50465